MNFNLMQEVRKLAEQFPDNRYGSSDGYDATAMCFYTKGKCSNKTKGCIYGQVLSALGYKDRLTNIDANYSKSGDSMPGIREVIRQFALDISEAEVDWHSYVQSAQDKGMAWGEAVANADLKVDPIRGGKWL